MGFGRHGPNHRENPETRKQLGLKSMKANTKQRTLTKAALILPTLFILAGCQSSNTRKPEISARDIANAEASIQTEQCRRKYPLDRKTAVLRAKCMNDASEPIMAYHPHPDLNNVWRAHIVLIAEQFRDGKITESELHAKAAEKQAQLTSESQRRFAASNPPIQPVLMMPMPTPSPMMPYRLPCPPGPYTLACRN